jgi:hypothetical protein
MRLDLKSEIEWIGFWNISWNWSKDHVWSNIVWSKDHVGLENIGWSKDHVGLKTKFGWSKDHVSLENIGWSKDHVDLYTFIDDHW